jgi:hypothetical protein
MSPLNTKAEDFKVTLDQDLTGPIEEFEEWTGEWGANYTVVVFSSHGMVKIREKKEVIDRQFKRMGLSIEQALETQQSFRFYRVPAGKPGQTFLNIVKVDAAAAASLKPRAAETAAAPARHRPGSTTTRPAAAAPAKELGALEVMDYPATGTPEQRQAWAVQLTRVTKTLAARALEETHGAPVPGVGVDNEDEDQDLPF